MLALLEPEVESIKIMIASRTAQYGAMVPAVNVSRSSACLPCYPEADRRWFVTA
jgi:hypothetical protein